MEGLADGEPERARVYEPGMQHGGGGLRYTEPSSRFIEFYKFSIRVYKNFMQGGMIPAVPLDRGPHMRVKLKSFNFFPGTWQRNPQKE